MLLSLLRACDHRSDLDQVIVYLEGAIQQKLLRLSYTGLYLKPTQIIAVVSETLQQFDPVAYVKYAGRYQTSLGQLRRAIGRP